MPLARLKSVVPSAPRRRAHLRLVTEGMQPAPSPARAPRQRPDIGARAIAGGKVDHWSVRHGTTMIVTSTCAAMMAMLMVSAGTMHVVM